MKKLSWTQPDMGIPRHQRLWGGDLSHGNSAGVPMVRPNEEITIVPEPP